MAKNFSVFFVSIFVIIFLFSACSTEVGPEPGSTQNTESVTNMDHIKELKVGDDYQSVVQKCGDPSMDIGSGVHILIYETKDMKDGQISIVKLNFSIDDKLVKISVLDEEGNTTEILLE